MKKDKHKIHLALSRYVGVCGFIGETTRNKPQVTCKFCRKLIRSGKYLY